MKILVIGGSYFLGGAFTLLASKEHELTLVNRGTYSMMRYGVKEYKADRRDVKALQSIPKEHYDVVVDFCAYEPGDIKLILENIKGVSELTKKYIFISTVDVYERQVGYVKDEHAPLATTRNSGRSGDYIYKKVCLEKELAEACETIGIDYTIIRPSIIYGPNDYSGRVETFIKMASCGIPIKYPKDSKAYFQMVYVKDIVEAILGACKQNKFNGGNAYNICPDEPIRYEEFMQTLSKVSEVPVKLEQITEEQALKEAIDIEGKNMVEILKEATEGKVYLPFPVTQAEHELYVGTRAEKELDIKYTSLLEGMKKTYNCFK